MDEETKEYKYDIMVNVNELRSGVIKRPEVIKFAVSKNILSRI